jgi:hypothetical protein
VILVSLRPDDYLFCPGPLSAIGSGIISRFFIVRRGLIESFLSVGVHLEKLLIVFHGFAFSTLSDNCH